MDEDEPQRRGAVVGLQALSRHGQCASQVVEQSADPGVSLGAESAANRHEVGVGPEVAQVEGGLGHGRGVQVEQGQVGSVPQELSVVEVAVGDDVCFASLPQAQAGVHYLLVQKVLLVDDAVAAGGGQPAPQHLGLLPRPVNRQIRLSLAQARPGLREPLPPGQAGVTEIVETAARQQLEIDDVVPVSEDPGHS